MAKTNTSIKGYNLQESGDEVEKILQSVKDKLDIQQLNEHVRKPVIDHPNGSVTKDKIANGAITGNKIANGTITGNKIADKAVGQGQIADYAVGQTQLAQYSVSSAKIYPTAVQTAHIKDGNVTREKLSEDIITEMDKITPTQQKLNEEIAKLQETDAMLNELSDKVDTLEDTSAAQKDLYGDAVEQTASLEIVIMPEELSQHITRVTTNYLETDILEVLGDILFDIDDHSVFNTANTLDLKSWNINSKFKIYETPDYQPIAICFDIDKKKVWVEKTDDSSYDNGVFKFDIASIEHPQFTKNSDGRYTVDYSYLFINSAAGHTKTTMTFNDIRSRWQIEMGSNFLDAVNNNTARLDSKVDKVSGKGLSTNDYTSADKAKLDRSPVWNQNEDYPNEYDTDADIYIKTLQVDPRNMVFASHGFFSLYEVTEALDTKKRFATLVVGTSESGHSAADVDYLCDGTDDQEQINAAIAALPSDGGKIILREGTYNISDRIVINKPNVTIEGMGIGATTIMRSSQGGAIDINAAHGKICSISIKGNDKANWSGGIYASGSHNIVCDIEVSGFMYGVNTTNIFSALCTVLHNIYAHDNKYGLHVGTKEVIVSNCHLANNERGINIEGSNNIFHDNICMNNDSGIYIDGKDYNQISGCYVMRGSGEASSYASSQYTIYIAGGSTYNDISDNYILGKNYINNGGSTNTFTNNRYQ